MQSKARKPKTTRDRYDRMSHQELADRLRKMENWDDEVSGVIEGVGPEVQFSELSPNTQRVILDQAKADIVESSDAMRKILEDFGQSAYEQVRSPAGPCRAEATEG
jgi:uncharacterized protein with von Willebrand factor type A (vWA) domain